MSEDISYLVKVKLAIGFVGNFLGKSFFPQ